MNIGKEQRDFADDVKKKGDQNFDVLCEALLNNDPDTTEVNLTLFDSDCQEYKYSRPPSAEHAIRVGRALEGNTMVTKLDMTVCHTLTPLSIRGITRYIASSQQLSNVGLQQCSRRDGDDDGNTQACIHEMLSAVSLNKKVHSLRLFANPSLIASPSLLLCLNVKQESLTSLELRMLPLNRARGAVVTRDWLQNDADSIADAIISLKRLRSLKVSVDAEVFSPLLSKLGSGPLSDLENLELSEIPIPAPTPTGTYSVALPASNNRRGVNHVVARGHHSNRVPSGDLGKLGAGDVSSEEKTPSQGLTNAQQRELMEEFLKYGGIKNIPQSVMTMVNNTFIRKYGEGVKSQIKTRKTSWIHRDRHLYLQLLSTYNKYDPSVGDDLYHAFGYSFLIPAPPQAIRPGSEMIPHAKEAPANTGVGSPTIPTRPVFDCAVYYPIVETGDFFQSKTCGWYVGRKFGQNAVEFLDGSWHEEMPDDLTIVQLKNTGSGNSTFQSSNKEVTVSLNDTRIRLGDLVCTFSYRGTDMEQPAWFRGRCAAKDPTNKTIGVAYDDGGYEKNVPIIYSIRIVPAETNHNWLLGLQVNIPDKSSKHMADFGIVSATEDRKITLQYTWAQQIPSKSVIQYVLMNCDQRAKEVRDWCQTPQKRPKPAPTRVTQKPTVRKKQKILHSVSKPKQRAATRSTTRAMLDEEKNVSPREENTATQKSSQPNRLTKPEKLMKSSLQEYWMTAVPATCFKELAALPQRDSKGFVPMSPADSNALLCMLEGTDTDLASDWLHLMANQSGKIPNNDMWCTIMDMMAKGPRNGTTKFPDKLKMTLILEYVEMLIDRNGLDLSEPLWQDEEDIGQTILGQIKSVLYGNTTFRKETIHAKMCATRMLRHILEWALTDVVRNGTTDPTEVKMIMKGLCFESSPRSYLVSAVDALAGFHGDAVDEEGFILELRQDLSTCISFFGWWYGVTSFEDADALAVLISDRHPADFGLINKLNGSLLPQVRPKLAARWGIADQYDLVYG